ncbi:MAG: hypothetical protein IKE42_16065 [Aquamicrobium sp.]|nr:hypothetical protein [Aquamicrobium sp.]
MRDIRALGFKPVEIIPLQLGQEDDLFLIHRVDDIAANELGEVECIWFRSDGHATIVPELESSTPILSRVAFAPVQIVASEAAELPLAGLWTAFGRLRPL